MLYLRLVPQTLHGWGTSVRRWPILTGRILRWPRAGDEAVFAEDVAIRDMAADAVGLLHALEIEQAHLVGISQGGAIAQLVAIDYPEHTLSLTLLMSDSGNPAHPAVANPVAFANVPPQPATADDQAAYIARQVATGQAIAGPNYVEDEATLRARVMRDLERGYEPTAILRQGTAVIVDRYEPTAYRHSHLATITAPTVVLQGDADPIVPVVAAQALAELIPNAELRMIPGLGHSIPAALVPAFADAIAAATAS